MRWPSVYVRLIRTAETGTPAKRGSGIIRAAARAAMVAMARSALATHGGVDAPEARFLRERCSRCGGSHRLVGIAVGEARVRASVSYASNIAAVAISSHPLGIDLEGIPQLGLVHDVLPLLHQMEQVHLSGLGDQARVKDFARIWTRKEALLKLRGVGLAQDLSLDDLSQGSPSDVRMHDFVVAEGGLLLRASVAICVMDEPWPDLVETTE